MVYYFIHFILITTIKWNCIQNRMSPNNGILLNAVLLPKLLNIIAFVSCSFIHFDFLHTAILMITLFYLFLVFTTLEFIFSLFFIFYSLFIYFCTSNNMSTCFIMVSTWKVLDYFYFKKLDLSTRQLAHLDFSLITLFVIINFFEPILSVLFYNWNNNFACFIMMEIFLLM